MTQSFLCAKFFFIPRFFFEPNIFSDPKYFRPKFFLAFKFCFLNFFQPKFCFLLNFSLAQNLFGCYWPDYDHQGKVKASSRKGQGKVERQGQGKINERLKQSNHNHNYNYNLMGFDTIEINLSKKYNYKHIASIMTNTYKL